jgi:Rad3-related DNA helicase
MGGEGLSPFPWPDLEPHALLERAFQHLHAWPRQSGAWPFEPRAGPEEMAHAVMQALLDAGTLVVEAGTGVGKTIAYALPVVLLAATRGGRFLVSTHTRNLQHQLVDRDLPELWRCLGLDRVPRPHGDGGLRFAKLLGRANYVCRTALLRQAAAARREGESFGLAQALLWSLRTRTGELEEIAAALPTNLVRELGSRREVCGGKSCRGETPCPVYAAREFARGADLVVVNHALLFSDATQEGGILGAFDALVLDESHHLHAVATEHLSVRVGRAAADALVAPLGRLVPAARALEDASGLTSRIERWGAGVASARRQLYDVLDALASEHPASPARRGRVRYCDGDEVFGPVREPLARALAALAELARGAAELVIDCEARSSDAHAAECAGALALAGALGRETGAALEFLAAGNDEDFAFGLDFGADGRALHEILAAPLDVAPDVQRLLGGMCATAVYTSATLAVGGIRIRARAHRALRRHALSSRAVTVRLRSAMSRGAGDASRNLRRGRIRTASGRAPGRHRGAHRPADARPPDVASRPAGALR